MLREIIPGISSYDIFNAAGTVLGMVAFTVYFYRRSGNARKTAIHLLINFVVIMAAALGSEILRSLNSVDAWTARSFADAALSHDGGNHFMGRLLLASWVYPPVYAGLEKLSGGKFVADRRNAFDAAAFYFVIQHIFNRIACFLNGCCYGKPYTGPGSVEFPGMGYSVWPSQLIEGGLMVLLLIWLIWLGRREKPLFGRMETGFGAVVFVSEFFMDQAGILRLAGLSLIQFAALLSVITGLIYIKVQKATDRKGRKG